MMVSWLTLFLINGGNTMQYKTVSIRMPSNAEMEEALNSMTKQGWKFVTAVGYDAWVKLIFQK